MDKDSKSHFEAPQTEVSPPEELLIETRQKVATRWATLFALPFMALIAFQLIVIWWNRVDLHRDRMALSSVLGFVTGQAFLMGGISLTCYWSTRMRWKGWAKWLAAGVIHGLVWLTLFMVGLYGFVLSTVGLANFQRHIGPKDLRFGLWLGAVCVIGALIVLRILRWRLDNLEIEMRRK